MQHLLTRHRAAFVACRIRLARPYRYGSLVCMKTTINLRDDLIAQAAKATGISEKTKLIHLGLEELVRKAAYQRLIALGGTDPKAEAAPRKKTHARPRR